MASFNSWLSPNVMQALGWTLIHSLWQCLSVAALAAVVMIFFRRPSVRYLIAVGALALMLAAPVATFFVLIRPGAAVPARPSALSISSVPAQSETLAAALPVTVTAAPAAVMPATLSAEVVKALEHSPSHVLTPNLLPWLVAAWLYGVAFFSLRLAGGFLLLEHRRRTQSTAPGPRILALCEEVQQALGLDRAIRYLECRWLQAPAVVGWIRPIVLLPVSALTGLSEEQLRAVIAHELAHIRRFDAHVNLFQILVETVLFYHPAVWWLNRRIRIERELCCDEIAVSLAGNRVEYARALTLMAEWTHAPVLAMAANRGPLSLRILHLLGRRPFGATQRMIGLMGSVLFLTAALAAANALFGIAYPIPKAHAGERPRAASIQSAQKPVEVLQASEAAAGITVHNAPGPVIVSAPAVMLAAIRQSVPSTPPVLPDPPDLSILAANSDAQPSSGAAPAATPMPASPSSEAAESITVTATPLPHGDAVNEFIFSYPTAVRTTDKIARWKRGICPTVRGLPAGYAAFITKRLIAIARNAGAPVSDDPKCRHNIEILFTTTPQAVGDWLRKDHYAYLGYFDNFHQADELAKVTHDIQAWYLTATESYNGFVRVDNPRGDLLYGGLGAFGDFSNGFPGGGVYYAPGAGRFNVGPASTLYNVIIVANPSKLGDYEMGSLADYIAMLALSQPKDFDACWEVPSITNLLSKSCQAERKTATLSDNDTRFLYGLYKMSTNFSIQQQRVEIRYFIEHRSAAKH